MLSCITRLVPSRLVITCLQGLALTIMVYCSGCRSVFMTDRQQIDLIPEKQEIALGAKAYQEVLDSEPKSQNAHLGQMLDRVGKRLAGVSERPDFQWEFTLLTGPTQNAFCLPGGKVAVYEGILPICANEAGLAVVMSHEIAHALARHGGERMTHQMAAEGGEWAIGKLLGSGDAKRVAAIKTVYGLGTQYGVLLPFSRTQEAEADSIGLLLMARAGYDPQEAPRFWDRFSRLSQGAKVPELLSTHPSDETRAAKLQEIVPRALSVYQSAPQRHGLGEQIPMQALAELIPVVTPPSTAPPATPLTTTAAPVPATPPAATPPTPAPAAPPAAASPVSTPPAAAAPAATNSTAPTATPPVAAITIAPAPVVLATSLTSPPATAEAPVTLPNLGAPTDEGKVQPAAAVTATAGTADAGGTIVPAVAESVGPATTPPSPPPAATTQDEPAQPPVLDETNGWKAHEK